MTNTLKNRMVSHVKNTLSIKGKPLMEIGYVYAPYIPMVIPSGLGISDWKNHKPQPKNKDAKTMKKYTPGTLYLFTGLGPKKQYGIKFPVYTIEGLAVQPLKYVQIRSKHPCVFLKAYDPVKEKDCILFLCGKHILATNSTFWDDNFKPCESQKTTTKKTKENT